MVLDKDPQTKDYLLHRLSVHAYSHFFNLRCSLPSEVFLQKKKGGSTSGSLEVKRWLTLFRPPTPKTQPFRPLTLDQDGENLTRTRHYRSVKSSYLGNVSVAGLSPTVTSPGTETTPSPSLHTPVLLDHPESFKGSRAKILLQLIIFFFKISVGRKGISVPPVQCRTKFYRLRFKILRLSTPNTLLYSQLDKRFFIQIVPYK